MKSIQLYTAALDNAGTRREAGDILTIGAGKTQIESKRAAELVESRSAAESDAAK